MSDETKKILVVRFSSFGDIVQASSCVGPLKEIFPHSQLHWVTRSDMSDFVACVPGVDKIWSFDRKTGLLGLIRLAFSLRRERYSHLYDAHSNTRSFVLCLFLRFFRILHFKRRSKERWKRFCLFTLKINKFPKPYRGSHSYLSPLKEWGVEQEKFLTQKWIFEQKIQDKVDALVAPTDILLVPSAAWEMKRWPLSSWKELIQKSSDKRFIVLGGPQDHFCQELEDLAPNRVKNLAGKLTLSESCYAVDRAYASVSADTGLLHVADVLGKKAIALIGPTAFGFPSSELVKILEVELSCRPCTKDGRGKCTQSVYQKCMVDISADRVKDNIQAL